MAFQSQRVTTDNLLHFQRETRRERKIDDWSIGGGGGGKIFATSEHMTTFPRPQSSQGARLGPKKDGSLLGCITQERFFKLLQSRVGGWEYLAHSHSPCPTMLILEKSRHLWFPSPLRGVPKSHLDFSCPWESRAQ